MNRTYWAGFLLIGLCLGVVRSSVRVRRLRTPFSVDKCVQSAGRVFPFTPIDRAFRVSNQRTESLRVVSTIVSANANLILQSRKVAPGKTLVAYLMKESGVPLPVGRLVLQASVFFDGIPKPAVFTIRGTVSRSCPAEVVLGEFLRTTGKAVDFEINSDCGRSLRILNTAVSSPNIEVSVSHQQSSALVQTRIKSGCPYGNLAERVAIQTDDPHTPTLIVQVKGHVLEPIVHKPDYISLGVIESTKDVSGAVVLRSLAKSYVWSPPMGSSLARSMVMSRSQRLSPAWRGLRSQCTEFLRARHSCQTRGRDEVTPGS